MKYYTTAVMLFLLVACTKKDIRFYKHYVRKNPCKTISMNADKQNTNDFFMIKTYDENGILRHLKTQLRDISSNVIYTGHTFVFDYDITYEDSKAIFKGTTAAYRWDLNNEEDFNTNPDPPVHAVEVPMYTNNDGFEIRFDTKRHYPTEVKYSGTTQPSVRLIYNDRGFLDNIITHDLSEIHEPGEDQIDWNDPAFKVITDRQGNILSILADPPWERDPYWHPVGVIYSYNENDASRKQNHFYEPPNIYIHPLYSILEVLGWGPVQPNLERTGVIIDYGFGSDESYYYPITITYKQHTYDPKGKLTGYTFDGDFSAMYDPLYRLNYHGIRTRTIQWSCDDFGK